MSTQEIFNAYVDPDALQTGNFACFAMVVQMDAATGNLAVLVVPSYSGVSIEEPGGVKNYQFPGGSHLPGESPQATLCRELSYEISRGKKPVSLVRAMSVFKSSCEGDPSKGGGIHFKYFFLVDMAVDTKMRGEEEPLIKEPDGEILGQPQYMSAESFFWDQASKKAHRLALLSLIRRLAGVAPAVHQKHQHLMLRS